MDLKLKNKIIIVSGGASGIGAAVCRSLAAEGAQPVSIDLNSGDCFSIQTDLCDPEATGKTVADILKKFGRIDGLVNNAGINDGVGLENGNFEAFVNSLNKNVIHYEHLMRLTLEELKRSRGAIVNIVSKVAFTGQGGTSGYAAANGMRAALTEAWAQELLEANLRVNAVVVAECNTPHYERWVNSHDDGKEKLAAIEANIPLGQRLTTPEEIADTVIFLLSPVSGAINRQLYHVDGGYVHLDRRAQIS